MAKLGDVCKLVSGNSLPETIVAENGELPYVKVAELNLPENIPNITTSRQFVSVENISAKQIVPVGTVIFPKRGGAIGTNKKRLVSTPICMDLNLMGVIPSSKLYPQYLYYFFENIDMGALSNGSSVPQINNSDIAPLEIRIPDITTQKDIAIRLDKVTELISLRKRQLAKLDELVKARFVEMFGDPQANPKGYAWVNLSNVATYFNGLTYKPENVAEIGTIVLRSSNIQNSQLDFADTVRVDCTVKEKLMVQENDILMCSRNGSARLVGKVALIKGIQEPMTFGAFMMIIRSRYHSYLMTYFQTDAFRQQIKTGATTTINQITGRMLDDVRLPLPPLELVKQFAAFVEQTDKSKLSVQQSLDKLETLKKALMQKYFG